MDSEQLFWLVALIVGTIAFCVLWYCAQKYGDDYVDLD